jgi:hypothetical protein
VRRLAGGYAFYDDGWQASVSLRVTETGKVEAVFCAHDRTRGRFDTTAEFVDEGAGPRLRLTVHNFNELPEQVFDGYVFRRGRVALAGASWWKGRPFSFFACRQPPYSLGPLRPETVVSGDFVGEFGLYCDGVHATLTLSEVSGATVRGRLREDGTDRDLPVTAAVDPDVPYRLRMTVGDLPGGDEPVLTLLMFPQRRAALAGWLDWDGLRLGCYAIRYRGLEGV